MNGQIVANRNRRRQLENIEKAEAKFKLEQAQEKRTSLFKSQMFDAKTVDQRAAIFRSASKSEVMGQIGLDDLKDLQNMTKRIDKVDDLDFIRGFVEDMVEGTSVKSLT